MVAAVCRGRLAGVGRPTRFALRRSVGAAASGSGSWRSSTSRSALGWFPASGYVPFIAEPAATASDHLILPAVVLGTGAGRGGDAPDPVVDARRRCRTDYVRTARAKGLPRRTVLDRYALRNSLIVVVTIVGLQLGGLISGAVVTERIFGLPGFGKLTLDAVFTRDYPVIQAVVLIVTATRTSSSTSPIDVLYSVINPRIRVGGSAREPTRRAVDRAQPVDLGRRARARAAGSCSATRSGIAGGVLLLLVVLAAVLAPLLAPYSPTQVHFDTPFQRPGHRRLPARHRRPRPRRALPHLSTAPAPPSWWALLVGAARRGRGHAAGSGRRLLARGSTRSSRGSPT